MLLPMVRGVHVVVYFFQPLFFAVNPAYYARWISDSGLVMPSEHALSSQARLASSIIASASSRLEPLVTQPSRSGI
jgi:hypothetical protein